MRAVSVALAAVLMASLAAPSATAHHNKGKHKPTTAATAGDTHNRVCPQVVEHITCPTLTVTAAPLGTSYGVAWSKPSAGEVTYNTTYDLTGQQWSELVAHEVGGHHDVWAELVVKVGTAQAWTDYYDIDRLAVPWIEARHVAVKGTPRTYTQTEAKEGFLDCAGPVAHGYFGHYLGSFGIGDQRMFCQGWEAVMGEATG